MRAKGIQRKSRTFAGKEKTSKTNNMKQDKLRIVFMGTPEFAVASLEALLDSKHEIVGVVTMPDKAIGRHHEVLQASPVKECALRHGIPVLQPEKLKDEEFLTDGRASCRKECRSRWLPYH